VLQFDVKTDEQRDRLFNAKQQLLGRAVPWSRVRRRS
jgi:hypothetical protein